MAGDAPKLNGFLFKHPPISQVFWEPQLVRHRLSDGTMARPNKGFILKGELTWGRDGWIDDDEYSNVAVMFNQLTGTALYFPRFTTYPTRSFKVQIVNDFNFIPHGGLLEGKQKYEGSIVFESSIGEITSTVNTTGIF